MAKILVIDDERAIRNTLKEILEMESHEVETAENGRIALDKAKQQQYDLIFSDIKMPEMDGMELLTALREAEIDRLPRSDDFRSRHHRDGCGVHQEGGV